MFGLIRVTIAPLVLIGGVFAGVGGAAGAQDASVVNAPSVEDQGVVDLFYRDKITAVRRTRGIEDDIVLIEEMVQRAQEIPDSPGVQRLIYETAVELGMSTGAFASGLEAAHQLRAGFPAAPLASDASLLDLYDQAYRGVRRGERAAIAQPYLALILEMALEAEASGEIDRAEELYRQGALIARTGRLPEGEVFEAHLSRLSAVARIESRIRVLVQAVRTNERSVTAAHELTMLLVLYREDSAAASEFVGQTQDPDLIEAVVMSAGGVDAASAPEALRVADWYFGLADEEEEYVAYLLGQAKDFYDRFLSLYTRDDALRSCVQGRQQDVADRLRIIRYAAEAATRGEWRDMIEQIDPEQHAILDAPTLRGGRISVNNSGFVIPLQPEGNYDLRMRLRYDRGVDGIIFYLPLGQEQGAVLQYSRWGHTQTQIDGVEKIEKDERLLLTQGREIELGIEVQVNGNGQASIVCTVDGEVCIRWQGEIDELEVDEHFLPSERHGNAITLNCGGRYSFRTIEFRELGD